MKHHAHISPRQSAKKKLFSWLFEAPPKAEQYIDPREIDMGDPINFLCSTPRRQRLHSDPRNKTVY